MKKTYSSIMKAHDKQVDDKENIFPMGSRIMCFCGKKGSGKTSAVISLLTDKNSPYYKYFNNIILCSPSAPHDDKMKELYEEVAEDGMYFDVLNEQTAEEMRDMLLGLFRNQLDCLYLYKTNSKGELESLKKDLPFDEDTLETNFHTATSEPYGFLYINMTGHNPKMYNKRFEELC